MFDFTSDYNIGAHPLVLDRLIETNLERLPGYGADKYCSLAEEKIKAAANAPDAKVYFLSGGTQTNAVAISAILRSYQGVISAQSGHIAVHEAGAIEYTGHKVITLPESDGKLVPKVLEGFFADYYSDQSREHTVMPGAVYISQPTEYGTLYSLSELEKISEICKRYSAYLYIDGARLGYAFVSEKNDTSLSDIARLCDIFYIGGTKVGALFGEALVVTNPELCSCFRSTIKQHGALFAKGGIIGVQFDALFTDDSYLKIAKIAVERAMELRNALISRGCRMFIDSYTNQQFVIVENSKLELLSEKARFTVWQRYDENHTVIRLVTNFATTKEEIEAVAALI